LILTREPTVYSLQRTTKGWFRLKDALLGVHSIRVFAKSMGDPYYEPAILVHDILFNWSLKLLLQCKLAYCKISILFNCNFCDRHFWDTVWTFKNWLNFILLFIEVWKLQYYNALSNCFEICYTERQLKGASWYQFLLQCHKRSQSYCINNYSRKILPMCCHTYRINCLWQEIENQQGNRLTIEPQMFCYLSWRPWRCSEKPSSE